MFIRRMSNLSKNTETKLFQRQMVFGLGHKNVRRINVSSGVNENVVFLGKQFTNKTKDTDFQQEIVRRKRVSLSTFIQKRNELRFIIDWTNYDEIDFLDVCDVDDVIFILVFTTLRLCNFYFFIYKMHGK